MACHIHYMPDFFSADVQPCCSPLKHPHVFEAPCCKLFHRIFFVTPQSQRHFRSPPLDLAIIVRRPNRIPTRSIIWLLLQRSSLSLTHHNGLCVCCAVAASGSSQKHSPKPGTS